MKELLRFESLDVPRCHEDDAFMWKTSIESMRHVWDVAKNGEFEVRRSLNRL